MNWWIIFITFLAVNLDFFFILIFLLERYNLRDVILVPFLFWLPSAFY